MREVLQHLAEALHDSFAAVADAAVEQLKQWQSCIPVFPQALAGLPPRLRSLCEEKLQEEVPKPVPAADASLHEETKKVQAEAMRTFSDSFTNGVDFGFLPSKVLLRLKDKENWKDRLSALTEAEAILRSLESVAVLHPHMREFLALLCDLVQDKNLKICTTGLSLLEYILSFPGSTLNVDFVAVVTVCTERLGDNKIMIRQATFKCLRKVLAVARLGKVMAVLADGLKSGNWHVREEVLNVLLACMLTPDQVHDVDFLELIPLISPLIDDEKPKVRYVAQETLAVLSHICGKERVVTELCPLLDAFAMESLQEKFNRKSVPIVRDDYIEFPRVAPASAPIQNASHHSPIPSVVQTPSHSKSPAFSFQDSITEPIPVLLEKPPLSLITGVKRRLKSASKRSEDFRLLPDLDSQPSVSPSLESDRSKEVSTRASSLNPLRISRKRVVKRPTFREKTAELIESAYENSIPAPLTKDLTPLRGSKLKERMRVMTSADTGEGAAGD